ncbi:MAG: DUF72 domain-containing protein [Ignavibacteriales bacterium]|nr:MAG: DUF72 domain-containing protein [Ignavibacteriales bacterium]
MNIKEIREMLRIGTCSWKYDSWKGIVYPDKEEVNFLEEYSKHFNTVEVDQWFWSLFEPKKVLLPKESDVKSYSESVPDNFRFTIKIPNSITLTHFYNKNKTEELKPNPFFLKTDLFEKFLETLKPMKKNIGVLMFQFEYLNKQKISGLTEYLDRFEFFIESIGKEYTYGVEIRNPNFLKKPFFEFLERNKLAMIFLQGYYMPPIWEVFNEYKDHIKSTTVIRLHGPDRRGIEKKTGSIWNQIVEPKDNELDKVAEIIHYLKNIKVDTYVNVNNHYEGSAPLTINKINTLIK